MWKHEVFDLDFRALNKQNVMVRFVIQDISNPGSGGYPGWFIDNLSVYEPYAVTGFAYNDLNANCVFDAGDSLLPNIHIQLQPSTWWWGNYCFTDIPVFDFR